jgi:chromosome segregation ATPase
MSNEVISADRVEGLEELINEILNKKITKIPSDVGDMEQLKKSPAGTIIRLEEQVNALDEKIDEIRTQMVTKAEFAIMSGRIDGIESRIDGIESRIDSIEDRIDGIENKMATKQDLERIESRIDNIEERIDGIESKMATKQDLERMATKEELYILTQEVKGLSIRIEEQGKRLSFFQTVTYSFLGVLFVMMVGILVKLFLP